GRGLGLLLLPGALLSAEVDGVQRLLPVTVVVGHAQRKSRLAPGRNSRAMLRTGPGSPATTERDHRSPSYPRAILNGGHAHDRPDPPSRRGPRGARPMNG